MRTAFLIGLFFFGFTPFASGVGYVFSFDDAPLPDGFFSGTERTSRFITSLASAHVEQAVFYCNLGDGGSDQDRARLAEYARAGHVIANHTSDHPDLNDISAERFIESIRHADDALKAFSTYQRWFRYPYLSEATSVPEKHDVVKKYLRDNGYRQGYVTVELYDWHINQKMHQAIGRGIKVDFSKLKALYLKVILESLRFYDALALKTLGRSPVHVLLFHENDLNALFLVDIALMLKAEGFAPVKASDAFKDPIADSKWDSVPRSMRRVPTIAKHLGYSGPNGPKWTSTEAIDALLDESGVFPETCSSLAATVASQKPASVPDFVPDSGGESLRGP